MLAAWGTHTKRDNPNMLHLRSRRSPLELAIDSPQQRPRIREKYRYNGQCFQSSQSLKIVPRELLGLPQESKVPSNSLEHIKLIPLSRRRIAAP